MRTIRGPAADQTEEDIRMNVDGVGAGYVRVATGVAAVAVSLMLAGRAPASDPTADLTLEFPKEIEP